MELLPTQVPPKHRPSTHNFVNDAVARKLWPMCSPHVLPSATAICQPPHMPLVCHPMPPSSAARCYASASHMVPTWCPYATHMLPICYPYATHMLPICYPYAGGRSICFATCLQRNNMRALWASLRAVCCSGLAEKRMCRCHRTAPRGPSDLREGTDMPKENAALTNQPQPHVNTVLAILPGMSQRVSCCCWLRAAQSAPTRRMQCRWP